MIEIALLRVSPDSSWLEFSVNCPAGYIFDTLTIQWYDVENHEWDAQIYDGSGLLPGSGTSVVMRIATSIFGTDVTMYKVTFGASETEGEGTLEEVGLCSNINFVYANLLDLVLSFTSCCISDTQYDNLDRNHMILYAHTEAMRLGREMEAIFFYDIIWNLFVNCGPTTRQNNVINKPCNCE